MSARRVLPLLLTALLIAAVCLAAVAQTPQRAAFVADELLVGVTPQADRTGAVRQAAMAVGDVVGSLPEIGVYRVRVARGLGLEQAAARLAARTGVRFVEPNYILSICATPNDTYFANQYGPKKIMADLAWGIWGPVAPVTVAIVDTGVDSTHPDLTNKILRDASGQVIGYNALTGSPGPAMDDHGHGTHCAGIAAAEINNGIGIAGIAGWNGQPGSDTSSTKIMPVKVLSSAGSGTTDGIANGIIWAANNGANVISLSLGGPGSSTLANAVSYAWNKGCVVVCAAGNSGSSSPMYPAAYLESIAVAATDINDALCSFSNWGSWVDVAAPGKGILSTTPTYSAGAGYPLNYAYLDGTSMACPHVSGAAALIWSTNPMLTNLDVRALIEGTTDPYTPYAGRTIANGRINVYRALGGEPPAPPQPPAAPTSLSATAGSLYVDLAWTQSTSPNVVKNRIYRSTKATSGFTAIATINATTTYRDTTVKRKTTYYYKVTAINSDNLESGFSNTVSIKTP